MVVNVSLGRNPRIWRQHKCFWRFQCRRLRYGGLGCASLKEERIIFQVTCVFLKHTSWFKAYVGGSEVGDWVARGSDADS